MLDRHNIESLNCAHESMNNSSTHLRVPWKHNIVGLDIMYEAVSHSMALSVVVRALRSTGMYETSILFPVFFLQFAAYCVGQRIPAVDIDYEFGHLLILPKKVSLSPIILLHQLISYVVWV